MAMGHSRLKTEFSVPISIRPGRLLALPSREPRVARAASRTEDPQEASPNCAAASVRIVANRHPTASEGECSREMSNESPPGLPRP